MLPGEVGEPNLGGGSELEEGEKLVVGPRIGGSVVGVIVQRRRVGVEGRISMKGSSRRSNELLMTPIEHPSLLTKQASNLERLIKRIQKMKKGTSLLFITQVCLVLQ